MMFGVATSVYNGNSKKKKKYIIHCDNKIKLT